MYTHKHIYPHAELMIAGQEVSNLYTVNQKTQPKCFVISSIKPDQF